jgi:glycosyltransferase involved in cell wall biosynthesis
MFDPLQPEDVAGAIVKLLRAGDLRQDYIEKGLARAASFSWERTAQATLAIYRQMASKR